jgi:hypothetical protein
MQLLGSLTMQFLLLMSPYPTLQNLDPHSSSTNVSPMHTQLYGGTRHVETADEDVQSQRAESSRQLCGADKLVRLNADQTDQNLGSSLLCKFPNAPLRYGLDGFVVEVATYLDIAESPLLIHLFGERTQTG